MWFFSLKAKKKAGEHTAGQGSASSGDPSIATSDLLQLEGVRALVASLLQQFYVLSKPHSVFLFLNSEQGEALTLACHITKAEVKNRSTFRRNEGILGVIARMGREAVFSPSATQLPDLPYYDGSPAVVSALGLPLPAAGTAKRDGLLIVDSDDARYFDNQERIAAIRGLAGTIAVVLKQSEQNALAERNANEYGNFYQLNALLQEDLNPHRVVEKTATFLRDLIGFDLFAIVRAQEHGDARLVACLPSSQTPPVRQFPLQAPQSIVACALKAKSAMAYGDLSSYSHDLVLFSKDVDPDCTSKLRSLYVTPLISQGNLYGAAVLGGLAADLIPQRLRPMVDTLLKIMGVYLEHAELNHRLQELAESDGLTGVKNHRHFQDCLDRELTRASRYGERLALLLLDLDFFKKVNDTHGHVAGDEVLRQMGALLSASTRKVDTVARYGGEEFAIMLVKSDYATATMIAERVREDLSKKRFQGAHGEFSVTMSIGIAIYPDDAEDKATLVEQADQALYASKHGGRNRATCSKDLVLAGDSNGPAPQTDASELTGS